MGNCLVTKLKGVVDNNRLPRLGYIRLKLIGGANSNQRIAYINIKGAGYIYDSNFNLLESWNGAQDYNPDHPDWGQRSITTGNGEIKYVDVPADGFFRYDGINLKEINGMASINAFSYCSNIYRLAMSFNPLSGNLTAIKSNKIIVLQIPGTAIQGTVESLVESQISLGRNSGNLELIGNDYNTFNGTTLPGTITITFSATGCVVKDANDNTLGTYTIGTGWTYNS